MKLFLYDRDEQEFTTTGLGELENVQNDEVREVLNGQFELTLQYPVEGRLFDKLGVNCYVTARPNAIMDPQPFRIYRTVTNMNGWKTIYARHIAYRLQTIICRYVEGSTADEAVKSLASNAVGDCPFQFSSDIERTGQPRTYYPMPIWTLMGDDNDMLRDTYGGEWEYDGFHVRLLKARGADRGTEIRVGVNLKDLQEEYQIGAGINGIYGYRLDNDGVSSEEALVMSSYYVEGEEKRLEVRDYTNVPDIMSLGDIIAGDVALEGIGRDLVTQTLKVDFEQLSRTEEYRNCPLPDRIGMGDTVTVVHLRLGVWKRLRVTEIRYQPSQRRYKSIVIGTPPKSVLQAMLDRL